MICQLVIFGISFPIGMVKVDEFLHGNTATQSQIG
jgi:hypothetical protein